MSQTLFEGWKIVIIQHIQNNHYDPIIHTVEVSNTIKYLEVEIDCNTNHEYFWCLP